MIAEGELMTKFLTEQPGQDVGFSFYIFPKTPKPCLYNFILSMKLIQAAVNDVDLKILMPDQSTLTVSICRNADAKQVFDVGRRINYWIFLMLLLSIFLP